MIKGRVWKLSKVGREYKLTTNYGRGYTLYFDTVKAVDNYCKDVLKHDIITPSGEGREQLNKAGYNVIRRSDERRLKQLKKAEKEFNKKQLKNFIKEQKQILKNYKFLN